jgi:hypothetical protein
MPVMGITYPHRHVWYLVYRVLGTARLSVRGQSVRVTPIPLQDTFLVRTIILNGDDRVAKYALVETMYFVSRRVIDSEQSLTLLTQPLV